MKILQLIIKKIYFDQIMSGDKKEEIREIKPTTATKYCTINEEGYTTGLIQYDAIRFYVGYNKDRATALVEVTGELIEELEDEKGDLIFYEYKGDQQQLMNIVYSLGKIIEK